MNNNFRRPRRVLLSPAEKAAIETYLLPPGFTTSDAERMWEEYGLWLVNQKYFLLINLNAHIKRSAKTEKVETRIFLVNSNRFYVFLPGGKLESEAHMLDLTDISSSNKINVRSHLSFSNFIVDPHMESWKDTKLYFFTASLLYGLYSRSNFTKDFRRVQSQLHRNGRVE